MNDELLPSHLKEDVIKNGMADLISGKTLGSLPEPLGDLPGLVINNTFYIFGGGSGKEVRDVIWSVDHMTGECLSVGKLPYPARGHQAVSFRDDVYILGGFDGATRSDLYRLSSDFKRVEQLKPMPQSNAWFSATAVDNKIVIVGGFSIPDGYSDQTTIYDIEKDEWQVTKQVISEKESPNHKIGANALAVHGNSIFSFGGANEFDPKLGRANALDIVVKFDMDNNSWSEESFVITPREGLIAIKKDSDVYLVGGMEADQENASRVVERVSLENAAIEPYGVLQIGRLTPAVGIVENRIVVAGGVTEPLFNMTDSIEYFDLQ